MGEGGTSGKFSRNKGLWLAAECSPAIKFQAADGNAAECFSAGHLVASENQRWVLYTQTYRGEHRSA